MGKFKSSGIIISTGTGSSGWLYSARQITPNVVGIIQKIMGSENNSDLVSKDSLTHLINFRLMRISLQLSAVTTFFPSIQNAFIISFAKLTFAMRGNILGELKVFAKKSR